MTRATFTADSIAITDKPRRHVPALALAIGICLVGCSCKAAPSKSDVESAEENPQPPTPAAESSGKVPPPDRKLIDVTAEVFKKKIAQRTAVLQKSIDALDSGAYERWLAELEARAKSCQLDGPIAEMVEAYRSGDASTKREQGKALRAAVNGKDRKLRECVEAHTAEVNEKGFLVSGLLADTTPKGKPALKPTIKNPGQALLLWPQIVTRWPGRKESAVAILDPTKAPWRVHSAYTFEDKVGTHSQLWKYRGNLTPEEFLEARKNYGHFLLMDEQKRPLGWIDMDVSAFFEPKLKRSVKFGGKQAYTGGLATAMHGAVYRIDRPCAHEEGPGRCEGNQLEYYDMLSLVRGSARQRWQEGADGKLDVLRIDFVAVDRRKRSDEWVVPMVVEWRSPAKSPDAYARILSRRDSLEWPDRFDELPCMDTDPAARRATLEELPKHVGR